MTNVSRNLDTILKNSIEKVFVFLAFLFPPQDNNGIVCVNTKVEVLDDLVDASVTLAEKGVRPFVNELVGS